MAALLQLAAKQLHACGEADVSEAGGGGGGGGGCSRVHVPIMPKTKKMNAHNPSTLRSWGMDASMELMINCGYTSKGGVVVSGEEGASLCW